MKKKELDEMVERIACETLSHLTARVGRPSSPGDAVARQALKARMSKFIRHMITKVNKVSNA